MDKEKIAVMRCRVRKDLKNIRKSVERKRINKEEIERERKKRTDCKL